MLSHKNSSWVSVHNGYHDRDMATFNGTLLNYQRFGVAWMREREMKLPHSGMNCDAMGLGKTIQMIALCCERPGRTLIVCPPALVKQWASEIERFTCGDRSMFSLTTYGRLKNIDPKSSFKRVIFDEGHVLRNPSSQVHAHARVVASLAMHRWIVTGTPVFNSPKDIWALASLVVPTTVAKLSRTKEHAKALYRKLALSRKRSVLSDIEPLPELSEKTVEIQLSDPEQHLWDQAVGSVSGINLESIQRLRLLGIDYRLGLDSMATAAGRPGPGSKLSKLYELLFGLDGPLKRGEKAIVFCNFHKEIDLIRSDLQEIDPSLYVRIFHGKQVKSVRDQTLNDFRNHPDSAVFLATIKSGGTGLNIQEANHVYIVQPYWNTPQEQQAICRLWRTGQTRPVKCTRLVIPAVESSIDHYLQNLQHVKALDDPTII